MENTSVNYSNVTTNSTMCLYDLCVEDTLYRKIVGSIIFIVVWPFIVLDMKWFPISRPAAALVGATFMVIFVVVPQDQVFYIVADRGNLQTIFLLVGMMLLSYYYDREGLLRIVALWIFGSNKPFKHVLWKICILSAIMSAIITNDATCLVITPLLLNEHIKQGRSQTEFLPMLLGIATSANIGSASTFFGNPQNAFIAANAQVSLLIFFVTSLPAAILGLLLSIVLLYLICFRTVFPKTIRNHVENDDNHENAADFNPNAYNVEATEQMLAPTLSASREEIALSYDSSTNPHLSSQISYERQKMYSTASGQDSDTGVPKSRSRYSLPEDFRRDPLSSPQFSLVNRKASLSNPSLSTSQYGATQESSSQKGFRRSPHSLPSPHHHVRISEQHRSNRNSLQRGTPLPEIPERETLQHELPLTNEGEGGVVETVSIKKRKWQEVLFIVWLIAITVVMVVLLAVPPLKQVRFNLGLVPLGAGILTMLADTLLNRKYPYDAITKIDWAVILMFMGLFVWLGGVENTKFPSLLFDKILPYMDLFTVEGVLLFSVIVVIGSNVLSNVPLVIIIVDQLHRFYCGGEANHCTGQLAGVLLAWVSTIAGNFTLIGSVANLIVAEKARSCANYRLTFLGYLKFGFVSTLVVLFAGLPIVYFTARYVNIPVI